MRTFDSMYPFRPMCDRPGPPGRLPPPDSAGPATMATHMRFQAPVGHVGGARTGPWRALRTADGKHVYYHDVRTNETTWTRPSDYVDPGPVPSHVVSDATARVSHPHATGPGPTQQQQQILVPGTSWYEVTHPGKPSYFHHPATKRVTWTPPPEVLNARTTTGRSDGDDARHGRGAPRVSVPGATDREVSNTPPMKTMKNSLEPKLEPKPNADAHEPEKPKPEPVENPKRESSEAEADEDEFEFDPNPEAYEPEAHEPEEMVTFGSYAVPKSALDLEDLEESAAAASRRAGDFSLEKKRKKEEHRRVVPEPESRDAVESLAAREFHELLRERNIDGNARWDRNARALAGDRRYKNIPSHAERRRLFERFVRAAAAAAAAAARRERTRPAESVPALEGPSAALRIAADRRRNETRAVREREEGVRAAAAFRKRNQRAVALERFRILLAERASDPLATWEASEAMLRKDTQGRFDPVPGAMDDRDRRELFEKHVSSVLESRIADARRLLESVLEPVSAADLQDDDDDDDDDYDAEDDDDDAAEEVEAVDEAEETEKGEASNPGRPSSKSLKKPNPFTSFVAASVDARLTSDPRWERCPLESRASAYCAHVEGLCVRFEAAVPREVAALRDELRNASHAPDPPDPPDDGEVPARGR